MKGEEMFFKRSWGLEAHLIVWSVVHESVSFRMLLRHDVFCAVPFHLSNRITVSFKERDENGIDNACDVILEVTGGLV